MADDYMSDDFLVAAEEVKNAGLTTSTSGKRQLKLEKSRYDNEERYSKKPKRDELEKERREEALNKPVSETSKGFSLMAKMGYKPGMSLGKKKDEHDLGSGIKEPLPLEVRSGRVGFGHDIDLLEQRRHAATRIKAEFARMKNDAGRHDEILEEFRKRKKDSSVSRKLIGDILSCRKACLDLDSRQELRIPKEPWFWQSFAQGDDQEPRTSEHHDYRIGIMEMGKQLKKKSVLTNLLKKISEKSLPIFYIFYSFRLISIVEYLREEHLYCIWCGHVFSSKEELQNECSGPLREDHEGNDF